MGKQLNVLKNTLGWQVKRSKIRREVENIAELAFTYVEQRLLRLSKTFENLQPPKKRNGCQRILLELDGCQIRTGILKTKETEELTPIRQIKKRSRSTDWREVRVGFARQDEVETAKNICCSDGAIPRSCSTTP